MCGVADLSYVGYVMDYYVWDLRFVMVHECGEDDSNNDDFSYDVGVVGGLC